ncbi:MAG: dihydropteroate synthase [Pseudomonadota bacterium]
MQAYLRPLVQTGRARPDGAYILAEGWAWFTHVERLHRDASPQIVPAARLPPEELSPFCSPRPRIAGLTFDAPRLMGILNVTPDSFSDGGRHQTVEAAQATAKAMAMADVIDVGGESTRPGAKRVSDEEEIDRVAPVIAAIRKISPTCVLSVDTRKSIVVRAAVKAGADLVNDVSGLTFDPALGPLCANNNLPICLMHAQGLPETMQQNPCYQDVVLDVYDFLAAQIAHAEALGIPRRQIIADPGIGFGKTLQHNLALLERLSIFHGLGVPVLLGASRKRFIGSLSGEQDAARRFPGSVGVALAATQQGVQLLRVHDVQETAQAIALWRAAVAGEAP